ncbi:MAG: GTPase Era [Saprospiraceae bacterium]|nr:GTPase Era [Saprospiraceae bacterium]
MIHKSGFVNIIGKPNVGKSTLMNALLGEKMSIITSKPQTTRHRILGIYNDENHQIIFSDSPGLIEDPSYGMHQSMNKFAYSSFEDADILLFVLDLFEDYTGEEKVFNLLKKSEVPKYLVINKIDLDKDDRLKLLKKRWDNRVQFDKIFEISALEKIGLEELKEAIFEELKEGPAYYPKDQLSDKNTRFFVSEIVRETILQLYKQEVPYSCEVIIDQYKESEKNGKPFAHIYGTIYVSRKTQKSIVIGKGGSAIKKLSTEARKKIEAFVDHPIFIQMNVKVRENWRDDERQLKHFGY